MKHKTTFPRARKTRGVRHRKSKCQCPDKITTGEVSDEVLNLNDVKQKNSLSESAPSCQKQIQKKKGAFQPSETSPGQEWTERRQSIRNPEVQSILKGQSLYSTIHQESLKV